MGGGGGGGGGGGELHRLRRLSKCCMSGDSTVYLGKVFIQNL